MKYRFIPVILFFSYFIPVYFGLKDSSEFTIIPLMFWSFGFIGGSIIGLIFKND